ncbi:MAG: ATP-binding protein [Synergistaceae bacterium]|nr:ATP-binding protein [Synergistaceae bacterium]
MKFIDRDNEMAALEKEYQRTSASFVVIYGRRRVGKTTLIREFIKDRKALYFLATEENEAQNIASFRKLVADFTGSSLLRSVEVGEWEPIFETIASTSSDERVVIVIDEFQYLGSANPAFPSIMQKVWDTMLRDKNIMLIICGSLISMMEAQALNYSSPLYGRRTSQIKLGPIPFSYYKDFFPHKDSRELLDFYSVTGGVPKYIEIFEDKRDIFSAIKDNILDRSSFLYDEAYFLLQREVSEVGSYFSILKTIAAGNEKLSKISTVLELKQSGLTRYLKTLSDLDIIEREVPITEDKPEKSKRGLYRIKDNYLRFWFRFIYPNSGYIESGDVEYVMSKIKESFVSAHAAYVYEDVCIERLWQLSADGVMPFRFNKAGRWWDGRDEIDIAAYDSAGQDIVFCECKYTSERVGTKTLEALEGKAKRVDWKNDSRRERFALFSVSGFTTELTRIAEARKDLILITP